MRQKSTKQSVDIFLYNNYVGKLSFDNGNLHFSYDENYLGKQNAAQLSASLPLQKEPFNHQITSAFFSGLLPDEYVRKRLAKYLQISEKNTFALLKEIGGECAGAVSIHPEASAPDQAQKPTYRILDNEEAYDILSALDKRPMLAGEEDIRISGAGAQDKLMICLIDGKIAIPKRSTPSTHIIKPAIKDLEDTVQNEFFCMKLAKNIGLPVPQVSIHWLENHPYYLIDRYDRRANNDGLVTRIHQEDFCQAMHIAPEMKYENEGGPTLQNCFSLLDSKIKSGVMAGKNKIVLLRGVVFNFIIGNGDAHGKNFSLLYEGKAESLAPFYDLMCTVIYNDTYKTKMAMKIGSKYKFQEVSARHFEELGESIGLKGDFIRKQINIIAMDTAKHALELSVQLNKNPQTKSHIYEKIIGIISKHQSRLLNQIKYS